jgi:2-dehydropantoate 2-reductase
VKEFRRFGIECDFADDEATLLWRKLVLLAAVALSTTAAGQPIGGVLSDPRRRGLMESCVREASEAAAADGADVDPDATIRIIASSPPEMRSSMQKDVAAGRPPELEAIAGPILRNAKKRGAAIPATTELLQEIQGRIHELG